MRRKEWAVPFALLGMLALALPACRAEEAPEVAEEQAPATPAPEQPAPGAIALPEGVTQEMVTQGQQLFTGSGNCFTCHGQDARGTQLAPNLTDQEWLNISGSYDEVVKLVKTGVPQPKQHPAAMPPMGGVSLTEDQVKAVAAYVYTLSRGGT
ncbi:MAG: c-type cytochrome [Gemmatimonadetes bacterium]|nr:c-type cytochrome [Gemmatimonadota bacterium]